jgi:hypothetical protein
VYAGNLHNFVNQARSFVRSKNQPYGFHLQQFGCMVAEDPLHGRVDIRDPPLKIGSHHHGTSRVQQFLHPLAGRRGTSLCFVQINTHKNNDNPGDNRGQEQSIEPRASRQARRNCCRGQNQPQPCYRRPV